MFCLTNHILYNDQLKLDYQDFQMDNTGLFQVIPMMTSN